MIEKHGDLLTADCDVICITTNAMVKKNGDAVMGVGVAKQAFLVWPGIATKLGRELNSSGNHFRIISYERMKGKLRFVAALPVKNDWRDKADLKLIERSLEELHDWWISSQTQWMRVALPRPGCGAGGLMWATVKPLVEKILPETEFEVWSL
jgi:hypothetical protein